MIESDSTTSGSDIEEMIEDKMDSLKENLDVTKEQIRWWWLQCSEVHVLVNFNL